MRPANTKGRRAANPLKVVGVAAGVGTVVLSLLLAWLSSLGARSHPLSGLPPDELPRKPVLSARRTPDVLSFVTRTARVKSSLAAVARQLPADSCLQVRWLGADMTSVRSAEPYTPGSAAKIVTAAVALDVLGADTTFETKILVTRNPDGSVADLFFVGGGDPLLVRDEYVATEKYKTFNQTSLAALADQIVAAGVTSVSGRLIGVDTYFDAERWVPDWPAEFHFTEAGPLGALMVNDGVVLGQPLKPDDPALAAATELVALLAARGVTVAGGPAHDALAPGAADLLSVRSAPLTGVLQEMLVNSDNNTAEILLKHIGLKGKGSGSTAAGLEVVFERLKAWNTGGSVVLRDGSGLSAADRISCADIQFLLDKFKDVLPGLLPVAGETGTLREAFTDSQLRGVLRGKTGTLSGVKALAGYVPLEGDDPVRFALLLNKPGIDNKTAYRPIWNGLANGLSRAQSSPRPAELAP